MKVKGTNDARLFLSTTLPASYEWGIQVCFGGYRNRYHILRFHGQGRGLFKGKMPEGWFDGEIFRERGKYGVRINGRKIFERKDFGTCIASLGFAGGWGGANCYDDVEIIIKPAEEDSWKPGAFSFFPVEKARLRQGNLGIADTVNSPFALLHTVGIGATRWTAGFWKKRFDLVKDAVIPYQWKVLNDKVEGVPLSHAMANLRIAAGLEKGEFKGMVFQDTDVYKWLEACAYVYAVTRDKDLDLLMDRVIQVISKAQRPDGYIQTFYTIQGKRPFTNYRHHEMYCVGHLTQAACAHYRATGKRNLLKTACRACDNLYRHFIVYEPWKSRYPGHPEVEMALVELYRLTGNRNYLDLAKALVERRGQVKGDEYDQTHLPIKEMKKIKGHAVRACYLMAGCADLYMETGDRELFDTVERLWRNMAGRKRYITGAVGARRAGEAFGDDFELPLKGSYAETCAGIGNAMWNFRMLLATGDAKYADLMETCLYNCILSGISLDGKKYFYQNPHEVTGNVRRAGWFNCACCPPNVARTIGGAANLAYATSRDGIWVNLYGSSEFRGRLENGTGIGIIQETDYPWDGRVRLGISFDRAQKTALYLRIPSWAGNAVIEAGDETFNPVPGKYAKIEKKWKKGNGVLLDLHMETLAMASDPRIQETAGKAAMTRGPIVYCLEQADLPQGFHPLNVSVEPGSSWEFAFRKDLLGGVGTLVGKGIYMEPGKRGEGIYFPFEEPKSREIGLVLVPYFSWANRSPGGMRIHFPIVY